MADIYQAIVTKFNASVLSTVTGGIGLDMVAPQSVMPYCRMSDLPATPINRTFGTAYVAPYAMQFSFFAVGDDNAMTAANAFAAVFDNVALTVDGASIVARRETPVRLRADPPLDQPDQSGKSVYMAWCRYTFRVPETFPR